MGTAHLCSMGCWLSFFNKLEDLKWLFYHPLAPLGISGMAGLSLTLCCQLSSRTSLSGRVFRCLYVVAGFLLHCISQSKSQSSPNSKRMIDTALLMRENAKNSQLLLIHSSLPFGHRYQTYKTHFTVPRSPKSLLSLIAKSRSRISSFPSVQFSSVAQSCPTLCDPMTGETMWRVFSLLLEEGVCYDECVLLAKLY